MLAIDFRRSPERISAFRELLQNPTFAEAIVCLKDEKPSSDVGRGADALDHVKALAAIDQHEKTINLLLSLAEPIPPELPPEEPTWGIDPSKFQKTGP